MNPKISLFLTGFIQVFFVAVNTYFIAKALYLGILLASFLISMVWSFNVKKIAFGSLVDQVIYSIGAAIGSICGVASSTLILSFFN